MKSSHSHSHSHSHAHAHTHATFARAELVPGPSAVITISSADALGRRLLFHVMDVPPIHSEPLQTGEPKNARWRVLHNDQSSGYVGL